MLIAFAVSSLALVIALVGGAVLERVSLPLWPAPRPRPYACHLCGVAYSDQRALGWHQVGQHPHTYETGGAS